MQNTKPGFGIDHKSSYGSPQTGVLEHSNLQNNLAGTLKSSSVHEDTMQKPPLQRVLTFASPLPLGSHKDMSKSFVKNPSSNEFELFMREAKDKFFKISKTLFQHQQQLNDLRDSRMTASSISDYKEPIGVSTELVRSIQRELENEQAKSNRILQEVDRLRSDITDRFLKKDEFEFNLNRFEVKLVENFTLKKDYVRDSAELREKIAQECRSLYDFFKKQIEANILHIHQANRVVFAKIEKDMIDVRQTSEVIKADLLQVKDDKTKNFFATNRKFYDPKIIRYKETVQRLSERSYEKPGEEQTISETTYYLDRDGYLLDKSYNYLVDHNNAQIQLDGKHLNLLRFYNLL